MDIEVDLKVPKIIYCEDIGEAEEDFEKLVLDGFVEAGEYHLVEYIHPDTGESRVVVACPQAAIARMFYIMLMTQRMLLLGAQRHPEMQQDIYEITEYFERDAAVEEFTAGILGPNTSQMH